MNLTGEKWIPVIYETGGHTLVSLNTLYADAEKIRDLCATPPQRIALMRLLVCITQRALDGPVDEQDWWDCRSRITPLSIQYLQEHEDGFSLYGARAFLQVGGLQAVSAKDRFSTRLDKLDIRLASGHAHTLFDRRGASPDPRAHDSSWIALSLLTLQHFALGGGQSKKAKWAGRPVNGRVNGKKNNNFTAGPSAGSKLFTLLRGQSLLDSIHLNLVPKTHLKNAVPTASFGSPVWEEFPAEYESAAIDARHRYTLLGRLVPLARFLRLCAEDHRMVEVFTNGLAYSETPDDFRDPMLTVKASLQDGQESQEFLRIAPNKHPWREFYAIAAKTDCGALSFRHLEVLSQSNPSSVIDVWVGGLLSSQGGPLEETEWNFAFPAGSLHGIDLRRYEKGVKSAARGEKFLRLAVSSYLEALSVSEFARRDGQQFKYKRNDKRSRAFRNNVFEKTVLHFWGALDSACGELLDICMRPDGNVDTQWHPMVWRALDQTYKHACAHDTPRQIQAFTLGRRRLFGWRKRDRHQSSTPEMQ
jgi:CRISPR system Cascade subunit CasA